MTCFFVPTCLHAPHESSHGRTGTATRGFPHHASHPLPMAAYGVPPPPLSATHSSGIPHRTGALRHIGHGFSSMLCHTYGVQPGHGRTSRSGGSPVSHVPHKSVPLSASGIRERNTVSSVFLASIPPPSTTKAPQDFSHEALLTFFHAISIPRPNR
jgi:hypothetical protein